MKTSKSRIKKIIAEAIINIFENNEESQSKPTMYKDDEEEIDYSELEALLSKSSGGGGQSIPPDVADEDLSGDNTSKGSGMSRRNFIKNLAGTAASGAALGGMGAFGDMGLGSMGSSSGGLASSVSSSALAEIKAYQHLASTISFNDVTLFAKAMEEIMHGNADDTVFEKYPELIADVMQEIFTQLEGKEFTALQFGNLFKETFGPLCYDLFAYEILPSIKEDVVAGIVAHAVPFLVDTIQDFCAGFMGEILFSVLYTATLRQLLKLANGEDSFNTGFIISDPGPIREMLSKEKIVKAFESEKDLPYYVKEYGRPLRFEEFLDEYYAAGDEITSSFASYSRETPIAQKTKFKTTNKLSLSMIRNLALYRGAMNLNHFLSEHTTLRQLIDSGKIKIVKGDVYYRAIRRAESAIEKAEQIHIDAILHERQIQLQEKDSDIFGKINVMNNDIEGIKMRLRNGVENSSQYSSLIDQLDYVDDIMRTIEKDINAVKSIK